MQPEKQISENLAILGIFSIDQLAKHDFDLDYWWQKKYTDIVESSLEERNELLINLNNAKYELDNVEYEKILNCVQYETLEIRKYHINANKLMNKKSSERMKKQGDKYREEFDFEKSLEFYSKSIEKDTRNTLAYIYRGFSKYELGNYSDASKDWKEGIQFATWKSDIYLLIGDFLLTRGKFSESLKYYDEGIKNNWSKPKLYFNRGLAKSYICDFEGSLSDFKEGFKLDPYYKDKNVDAAYDLVKKKVKERLEQKKMKERFMTSKQPREQLSEVLKKLFSLTFLLRMSLFFKKFKKFVKNAPQDGIYKEGQKLPDSPEKLKTLSQKFRNNPNIIYKTKAEELKQKSTSYMPRLTKIRNLQILTLNGFVYVSCLILVVLIIYFRYMD